MLATGTDLLSVTRALLRFGSYVFAFLAVGLVVLLATSMFGDLSLERSAMGIDVSALTPEQRILATQVKLTIGWITVVVALVVLRLLLAIVDSARGGDPFVPANGARLRRIGWLVLAGNLVVMMVPGIAEAVMDLPGLPDDFVHSWSSGLLTVLLIFVLARIFETGSRMRAELQETI